jgi:hypothetical protein
MQPMMPIQTPVVTDPHWMEQRVEWFEELLTQLIDEYTQILTTPQGRPAFQEPLTPAEQVATFVDPMARAQMEQRIAETGGPDQVAEYRREMIRLIESGVY